MFLGDSMGNYCCSTPPPIWPSSAAALVATGGHNVLEPALLGLPVLFGPHMFNFTEAGALAGS